MATFNDYYRNELKVQSDREYVLSGSVWGEWDDRHRQPDVGRTVPVANTGVDLAHAMVMNPKMRVLVLQGYFDLACPYGTVEYFVDHLNVPADVRRNVVIEYHEAGHMMYVHPASMLKFRKDVGGVRRLDEPLTRAATGGRAHPPGESGAMPVVDGAGTAPADELQAPMVVPGTRRIGASPRRRSRDHRQHDARRMRGLVVDRVLRDGPAAVPVERFAGVRVHVEAGEVAARDIEPDPVPAREHERGRVHLDRELERLAGRQRLRRRRAVAVARADDAVGDVQVEAAGKSRLGG